MDLLGADDMKWTMRIIARYAQKKLQSELAERYHINLPKGQQFIDYVHEDLSSSTNKGIRKIYQTLLQAGKEMPTQHHASMIVDLGAFFLWVAYKDTAYRDPLFWIVDQVIDDPRFHDNIQEYVKQPKDWYCPRWIQSKESTAQLRKDNIIPEFAMSPDERVFCPGDQLERINKDLEKQVKDDKLRRV